ncbi:MAG: hypothetical protein ACI8UR_001771 [Natronomonas sp.]|jgi:hypothetical protein
MVTEQAKRQVRFGQAVYEEDGNELGVFGISRATASA